MKKVKSIFIIVIALCSYNLTLPKPLSQEGAKQIAQDIFTRSVNQSIEDTEAIANIIGSIIIRELNNNDEDISESEQNKLKITAAAGYIASLIINHIKSKRTKHFPRRSLLNNKQEYLIDEITEKLVEISNEY